MEKDGTMSPKDDELVKKAKVFEELEWDESDDDDFDEEELQRRQESRAFWTRDQGRQQTPAQEQVQSPKTKTGGQKRKALPQQATPKERAPASAPATPRPSSRPDHTIKDMSAAIGAWKDKFPDVGQRARASTDVPAVDETTIPDTVRPAARARTVRRSDSTPVVSISRERGMEEGLGDAQDTPLHDDPARRPGRPAKRRKTDTSVPTLPDPGRPLFRGLSFYYIPADDVSPTRKFKITKAKEKGASWTKWPKFATHFIVEKHIRYDEIEKLIPTEAEAPIIVNEDYPIDCMIFKVILDPTQRKYNLKGQPDKAEVAAPAPPPPPQASPGESSSARSLQLKPPQRDPRRWDYVAPGATPDKTSRESSQASRIADTPVPTDSRTPALDLEQAVAPPHQEGEADKQQKATTTDLKDELSDFITLMQEYKDIPLDADEEDEAKSTAGSDTWSNSGSDEERKKAKKSGHKKKTNLAENFACNRAGPEDARSDNPNARTIEVLQKMATYYDRVNDHWRTTAYRKAIYTLKRQSVKITTEEEALKLPSIGQRLAQKIEEIVTTDKLKRLEYAEMEPLDEVLQLFIGIYGVGTTQAQQWVSQGFRTLDDLKAKAKLTTNQLIGIDHYEDLNTKIPRKEVEALGVVVKKAAARIDPAVELIIGGSYRRGAESSGDIDFIVTKSNTESSLDLRPFLDQLVKQLENEKFLVARLASAQAGSDGSKWHGCCVLPKIKGHNQEDYKPTWRRIDFLVVPASEMGAALIYFTGNDIFNRSMRLLASRKGMRLNQRGLYRDVMLGPGRAKLSEGELVEGKDERKIFDILGVTWREPHERWC